MSASTASLRRMPMSSSPAKEVRAKRWSPGRFIVAVFARNALQIIDCTVIPEMLFESVLFGHANGAFTGAIKYQVGLLHQADGGTAFFDEIGELPLSEQFDRVLTDLAARVPAESWNRLYIERWLDAGIS